MLAAPCAVWGLTRKRGTAAQTIALIEKLTPEQQTAVLSADHAVQGLACSGQALKTVALIEKLTPGQQTTVLAHPDAASRLIGWGQEEARQIFERIQDIARAMSARPRGPWKAGVPSTFRPKHNSVFRVPKLCPRYALLPVLPRLA